jgi:hypothetical protein
MMNQAVAKFLGPDWEDKVNSGVGLSCRAVFPSQGL